MVLTRTPWWAGGRVGQIVAEAVKTALPEAAPLGDPGLGRRQARRVGQGHRERLAEFARRRRSLAKPIYHEPPARVGRGLEDPVQISQLVNHVLEYESGRSQ